MSISDSLGRPREVELDGGAVVRYRERGDGEPVVFAHGLLMNGDLWRNIVPGDPGLLHVHRRGPARGAG